jgi:hypothetical protein
MEWLSSNWVLLAVLGGCIAMHLFGHGRHGSHGGHGVRAGGHGCCGGAADKKEEKPAAGVPSSDVPGR